MLTVLQLDNFKRFERLRISPSLITVLIGPNGAGKSSVIQSLALLRQSVEKPRVAYSDALIDLVSFESLVYRHQEHSQLGIGFQAELPQDKCSVKLEYAARFRGDDLLFQRGVISWMGWTAAQEYTASGQNAPNESRLGPAILQTAPKPLIGVPMTIKHSGNSGPISDDYQEMAAFAVTLPSKFPQEIKSWRFVPAIRGFAKHLYAVRPIRLPELTFSMSYDEISSGVASTMAYDSNIEHTAADWVEQVTGVRIGHNMQECPQISMKSWGNPAARDVPIVLEGFGTNQLAFLMFQLASAPMGGLVCIEEPETHLHPAAISKLADLFVSVAKEQQKQLLLTTHSDHLLDSLLNNVAEGGIRQHELALYYFGPRVDDMDETGIKKSSQDKRHENDVYITRLEVTSDGLVLGGLPGFFQATVAAQTRHLDAIMRKK